MTNSQVMPDDAEQAAGVKRPLTLRTPKLVTAAVAASGSTLIRPPRPADTTPDRRAESSDTDHLFAEPAIVWQESAAEARRKLWGAADGSAPSGQASSVLPDSTVLPEPTFLPDPFVAPDTIVALPTLASATGAVAVVAPEIVAEHVGEPATEAEVSEPVTMPPPVVLAPQPQLMPPPEVPPALLVESDPILVPIFVPERRIESPAEALVDASAQVSDASNASAAIVEVEAAPALATAAAPLVLPASAVPARGQTRAPLVPVAEGFDDFTKPGKNKSKTKTKNKVKPRQYRGQKRHPIRKFFGFVIVLGLLGGAGYAGWYKYLRKAATWSADLKPAAEFVEKTLHREFNKTVPVVTLDPAAYESKLITHVLGQLYANPSVGSDLGTGAAAAAGVAAGPIPQSLALRAVGLVGTELPASVGGVLTARVTSFYSGSDHTIYRMDGTTAVFQVGMLRSLSAALIDQAVDTTGTYSVATDASRVGLRGIVDGVANIVVESKFTELPSLQLSMEHELETRLAALPDPATPVYLFPYLSSYEMGGLGHQAAVIDRPLDGVDTPADDGSLFDPSRVPAPAPEGAVNSPSSRTLGMEFWFDALTPTLGFEAARQAALLWTNDTSATTELAGQACLKSTISTADAEGQAALMGALTPWIASRPVTSAATAEIAGTNGVTISMCSPIDVVEAVPTADAGQMVEFFSRADVERLVLGRATELGLPATPAARSCAVAAYRNGSINNVEPGAVDAATVAQITDVVKFCSAVS